MSPVRPCPDAPGSSPFIERRIANVGEDLLLTRRCAPRTAARAVSLGAVLFAMLATSADAAQPFQPGAIGFAHRPVCGSVPVRVARCHSEVVVDATGAPLVTAGRRATG